MASLGLGDAGSIPGPVQWVKALALLKLWCRSQLWPDLIPGAGTPNAEAWQKRKKKEKRKEGRKKERKRKEKKKKRKHLKSAYFIACYLPHLKNTI